MKGLIAKTTHDDVDFRIPSTGQVEINVCSLLDLDANARTVLTSGMISASDALRLNFNYHGTTRVDVAGTRGLRGTLLAPEAEVFTADYTEITGMIWSEYTDLGQHSVVDATGLTGAACHQAGLGIVTPPPPPPSPPGTNTCDYAMMASGAMVGYANEILGGNVGGGTGANALYVDWGVRPHIEHDYYSQGTIFLSSADVDGVAQSVGAYSAVSSNVGPGSGMVGSVPSAPLPTESFTCGRSGQGLPDADSIASGDRTIPPGNYHHVHQQSSGRLTLQAGTYYMDTLTMDNDTQLVLPPAPAVVEIRVCGHATFGDRTMVSSSGLLTPSDAFRLDVYANGDISIGINASLYGIFRAGSTYTQNHDSRVFGLAYAAQTWMFQRSLLDARGIAGSAECWTKWPPTGGPPPGPPVCTVSTPSSPPPPETGTCVANDPTFIDMETTCTDADLAVEINCSDEVTICNHGSTGVAANDAVISFFPRAGQQFGSESPDPFWLTDTCTVTSAIAPGSCVVQSCAAIWAQGQDFTMMVNYDDSMAVKECSLLDNWSYFDSTRTCSGLGTPPGVLVEVQDYEATCPANSNVSWGLLAWETDTPANSNVIFEAATATTVGGLAAVSFQTIGTAEAAPVDTSSCPFTSGLAECPVDLTAELWPGGNNNQPTHLRMRMTLNPDGNDSPTLRDWQITYSCIIDQ